MSSHHESREWHEPVVRDLPARQLPAVVRFTVDYGAELPLWAAGFGNVDWKFTGLPNHLLDRLADWQDVFNENFDPKSGWGNVELRDRWAREACRLIELVRSEFGERIELEVDLWPLRQ